MTAGIGIVTGDFGRVALLDMDTALTTHAHRHCHIVMKVDGPDQHFVVEGKSFPLDRQTAVVVNSWQEHSYAPADTQNRTLYLAFYLDPDWLGEQEPLFTGFADARFFEHPSVPLSDDVSRRSRDLIDMLTSVGRGCEDVEQSVLEIVTRIARDGRSRRGASRRMSDFRIRRALRHMHETYERPYDYDRVAREAGLSRSRFNVLFRETVGVAPAVYGNAIRLEASVDALRADIGAGEVAERLGFSTPGNFTRFFQQHTGVPPAAYRRALSDVAPREA